MSAITVGGSAAGSWIFLPCLAIAPSAASSRKVRFNSTRSAFLRPNWRAISRVPTFPGCARMNATMASRSGKTLSRCLATLSACLYPLALPTLFLATGFTTLAGEVVDIAVTGARALLAALDFGFAAVFFATAFLTGFGALAAASTLSEALAGFAALAFLAARFGLPAPFATRSSVSAVGFGRGEGFLGLVAGDRGIDAAGRDIGAVAAALDRDPAEGRMIAQRLAGIRPKTPAARAFGDLLGNQRDGAVEPDVEHLVAGLEAGIGLLVTHEGTETAKPRGDRLAGLRMPADLARQRQQLQGEIKVDVAGRHVLRNAGALRLFALGIILGLAELDVGTEPSGLHHHFEIRHRILAEDAIGAGLAVGRERAGVAAFRIIRTADEGAELSGLEVELAGAASRALPDIAAILARRIDVRSQHVVERIEHLGDAQVLDLVHRADEVDPEILQHLLPGNLVVGDAIELFFKGGGEVIFDITREEVFQERDHDAPLVLP